MIISLTTIALVALLVLIVVAYDAASWGWVFFKFYHWFVLPVYVGIADVTFAQSVGLVMFLTLFKTWAYTKEEVKDDEKVKKISAALLRPWLVLLTGYIVKCWFL